MSRTYFDTTTTSYSHYHLENEGRLIDIPADFTVDGLPEPPPETEITWIDIIVRLKPIRRTLVPYLIEKPFGPNTNHWPPTSSTFRAVSLSICA